MKDDKSLLIRISNRKTDRVTHSRKWGRQTNYSQSINPTGKQTGQLTHESRTGNQVKVSQLFILTGKTHTMFLRQIDPKQGSR